MDKVRDQKIMYILKTTSVSYPICKTPLGTLELNITKDGDNYFYTLDSVLVDKDTNKALLNLLNS